MSENEFFHPVTGVGYQYLLSIMQSRRVFGIDARALMYDIARLKRAAKSDEIGTACDFVFLRLKTLLSIMAHDSFDAIKSIFGTPRRGLQGEIVYESRFIKVNDLLFIMLLFYNDTN